MDWTIAQAKQRFSEVVKAAAEEPQAIYNRATPVAVVLNTAEFEQFRQWKSRQGSNPLLASLVQLRAALGVGGFDGIEIEARPLEGRPNSFEQMLDEEHAVKPPSAQAAVSTRKSGARGTR